MKFSLRKRKKVVSKALKAIRKPYELICELHANQLEYYNNVKSNLDEFDSEHTITYLIKDIKSSLDVAEFSLRELEKQI